MYEYFENQKEFFVETSKPASGVQESREGGTPKTKTAVLLAFHIFKIHFEIFENSLKQSMFITSNKM